MKSFSDGERVVTTVATADLSWRLDVATSAAAPVAVDAPPALTRGILVGLGVSAPLWLGIVWLISWLAAAL